MALQFGYKADGTYGLLDAAELPGITNTNTSTQVGPTTQAAIGLGESLYLGQTPEYWQKFGSSGGKIGDESIAGQALANKVSNTTQDDSLFGLNTGEWDNALKAGQIGIGAGQLGLGLASYFQNADIAKNQKELLGQQIESNRAEIDARKNYRSALEKF